MRLVSAAIFVMTVACGRLGYDGGGGEHGDGGASDDAASGEGPDSTTGEGPDAMTGEGPDAQGDPGIMVTTSADESDDGATEASPGGSGLSLREAIAIADATAGMQTITVPDGTDIALVSQLTGPDDPAGTVIVAAGAVLDGSSLGGITDCWVVAGGSLQLHGMEIVSCPASALQIDDGAGHVIRNCNFHNNDSGLSVLAAVGPSEIGPGNQFSNNAAIGLFVDGAQVVRRNVMLNNGGDGIRFSGSSAGALALENLVRGNGTGIRVVFGGSDVSVLNNTIHANIGDGIVVTLGSSTGVVAENNILSSNGDGAIDGSDANFASLDFNDYSANVAQCQGCTPGANSLTSNPMYVNSTTGDFGLSPGSPCIDAGNDRGHDLNGASAGMFNGLGPDIGAFESEP